MFETHVWVKIAEVFGFVCRILEVFHSILEDFIGLEKILKKSIDKIDQLFDSYNRIVGNIFVANSYVGFYLRGIRNE